MSAHVRLITPITTTGFRRLEDLAHYETSELKISLAATRTGPGSIESAYETAFSEPGTVARIIEAESEGVDAVVVDCMADPALQAARECVSIPVVGPSQTAMHLAAMLGHTFTVLTVLSRLRPQFENLASVYGLRGKLAAVRAVDIPVLELESDIAATQARLVEVAERSIVDDGAHAVVFGCTGLLGCAAAVRSGLLERGYDIPVIDPIPSALRMAALLIEGGLSHSKLTWPAPPAKPMVGYSDISTSIATAAE